MRQWIVLAAALGLAACGSDGEGGNASKGGGSSSASVQMQPGEWEMTTTATRLVVPGMPSGMPMPPPQTARTCVTPEQAASPTGALIRNTGQNGECTTQSNSAGGGRIQATVQCQPAQGGTVRIAIDGRYTPTTVEITQQIRASGEGQNMEMDARTTGRRIGDCPAGAAGEQQNKQ